MDHAGTDEGPAGGLMLLAADLGAIAELATCRGFECVEVEARLLLQAVVDEEDDLEQFVDRSVDLLVRAAFGERRDDQRIEFRMLRFLHPVMAKEALEQRIDIAVVAD